MRFHLISYLVLIFSFSCSTPKTNEPSSTDETDSTTDDSSFGREIPIPLKSIDLVGKIFEVGSRTDFTDSCAFYFECDCCYGHLIFNSDSTFYNQGICVADLTLTNGKYSFKENTLTLEYSGIYISKIYNWDYETDTTLNEYQYKDTVIQSFSRSYLPLLCDEKVMLRQEDSGDEILLQSDDDFSKSFFLWENVDLKNRLNVK